MERIPSLRNALLILSMLVAGDMRFLLQELVEGERRITIKSSWKKMIIAMIIILKKRRDTSMNKSTQEIHKFLWEFLTLMTSSWSFKMIKKKKENPPKNPKRIIEKACRFYIRPITVGLFCSQFLCCLDRRVGGMGSKHKSRRRKFPFFFFSFQFLSFIFVLVFE